MSEKTIEQENKENDKHRKTAMFAGGFVYTGGVTVATLLFISFVLLAFPENAYMSKAIMTVGGALIGASMLAFPYALHNWTVESVHRGVAIGLYLGELAIVALNTVTAFSTLMARFGTNMQTPAWVGFYEPLSIGAIIYTVFAWGMLYLLDPAHKRKARALALEHRVAEKVTSKEAEFWDSPQGEDEIELMAIQNMQAKHAIRNKPETWGTGRNHPTLSTPAPASPPPPALPNAPDPEMVAWMVKQLKKDHPQEFGGVSDEVLGNSIAAQLRALANAGKNGGVKNP